MIDINKLIKKAKNFDDIFCIPNDKNIDKIIDEYSSIESIKILNKEKVKFEKLKKIKDYTYLLPIKIIKKIKEIGKASIFDYISIICFRSCNNFKRGYKYSILVGTIKSFHEYTEHNEKKQYHFLIDTFKNDTTYNDLAK